MSGASGASKARAVGTSTRSKAIPQPAVRRPARGKTRLVKIVVDDTVYEIKDLQPGGLNDLIVTTVRGATQGFAAGVAEFTVRITRDGSLSVSDVRTSAVDPAHVPPKAPEVVTTRPPENEAAFAEARERGRHLVAQIMDLPGMLSAEAFGERLNLSRVAVNDRRQRHEFLGLEGTKRGFKYPDWQIREDGRAFAELPRLFDLLGGSPWVVYRFLVQSHAEFGGHSALEELRKGNSDAVIEVAEGVGRGDFA